MSAPKRLNSDDVSTSSSVVEDEDSTTQAPPRVSSDIHGLVEVSGFAARELRTLTWLAITMITVASLFVMYYARAVVMPLVVAIMVSFLLRPFQRVLTRIRIPRAVSAALLILASVTLVGTMASVLAWPAAQWMERLPESARELDQRLRFVRAPLEELSAAGERMQEAAEGESDEDQPVEVKITAPTLAESLLSMTGQALGTLVVTIVLVYFMLASDQRFLRKLVEIAPRIEDKKRVVETLRSLESDVSRYLLSITLINAGLGVVIGLGLWMLGMPNPILWGVMAAALNYLPYVGALVGTCIIGLASLVTFDTIPFAVIPPAFYLGCSALEGQVLTPYIVGLRLNLDPLVIFLSLLAWGWLWGVPGAILAVPILATVKILCDRIERLHGVANVLSGSTVRERSRPTSTWHTDTAVG